MKFNRKEYTEKTLVKLYESLLRPRMIEEKMLILLRQGKISKWFSGIGQEAISVGAALALQEKEYILPMHRNLGVFTSRLVPYERLFAQLQGKPIGYTQGRDRSFHFGAKEHHIVGMISHLGAQLAVADGIALAHRLKKENKVVLVFCGDGGSSEGDFHEALNVASVWNLPIIFVIENNGYGLSTPNEEQFNFNSFTEKGPGYGMDAIQIDGNNILEVYDTIGQAAANIRNHPRPILIEALTFRMRGHEEASGTAYVPKALVEKWAKKDPIGNYEGFLLGEQVLNTKQIAKIKKKIHKEIDKAWKLADRLSFPEADSNYELKSMYAPFVSEEKVPQNESLVSKRLVDAISDGLFLGLKKYKHAVLMGQDIADYGGVFKVTKGFLEEFGKERIRNTPICESAILGMGLGLSVKGYKTIIEMQFADFVSCGFNQIVNNLAKSNYRWGQHADVVIRMPTGAGVGAGPFHSQSTEAWFFHTPGLKVFYPSNPYDAKGLLLEAIEDPNPVLFFEHKYLYRSIESSIPEGYYTVAQGKASLVQKGEELSIITYGLGVHWAVELCSTMELSADILDLRTLLPWDKEAVENTIKKTGRVIILHEDCITGGVGAEIAAWAGEHCFQYLDAPILREGSLDTAVPFAPTLEENFLPKQRLVEKIKYLLDF